MTDRQFMQVFGIILGVLAVFSLVLLFLAGALGSSVDTQAGNKYAQQRIAERIQSRGQVAVREGSGGVPSLPASQTPQKVPANASVDPTSAAADSSGNGGGATAAAAADGQATYEQACFACHGTGAAGAPRTGDTDDWAPRIAQGHDVLVKHALEGYMGERGYMPAKGGQTHLSDEAVIAALDHMLEQSQ